MQSVFSSVAVLATAVASKNLSGFEKRYAAMNDLMNGSVLPPPLADNSTYGNTE